MLVQWVHILLVHIALSAGLSIRAQEPLPESGDDGNIGGIFGISFSTISKGVPLSIITGLSYRGPEYPRDPDEGPTSGSGPFPAHYVEDPTLPGQTIYAPKEAPRDVNLPAIVWGNGGCVNRGTLFSNMLTEIASHGYIVIANGPASGISRPLASVSQQKRSLDWLMTGNTTKYGMIDTEKIAAAGQSCGGLESYSTSYHEPRIKLTMIFNVGVFDDSKRYLIKELTRPIVWFVGGEGDPGTQFAVRDYNLLRPDVPAILASFNTGHQGTYGATNGGAVGRAAVAYLQWQFRDNMTAKEVFTNPSLPSSLASNRWNVTYKNY